MKNKKGLINFLAGFTKIVLILVFVLTTAIFIVVSIQLFSNNTSKLDSEYLDVKIIHEYDATLELDTKIWYRSGRNLETTIETSTLSAPVVFTGSNMMTVLYLFLLLLLMGNVIFLIFQFYKIFSGLKESIKQNTFFYRNIHTHIKRLAYSLFAFAGLDILNKLFFIINIEKIEMMGKTVHSSITLGSDTFLNIFFGIIILVIAEIFREGLKLKQETELTI